MARQKSPDICPFCKRPDDGGVMVKLSDGWAHKQCSDENTQAWMAIATDPEINRPIEQCRWVCGQCGRQVRSIFHATENGTRICAACSVGFRSCKGAEKVMAAEAALDAAERLRAA